MSKKVTSVLLALCMLNSCAAVGNVAVSAASTADDAAVAATDYGLPDEITDGNILHCFNWKYSDIQAALPSIAAAGFTSVQTSPAQQPDSTGAWYWLYQPLNFSVASGPLGNSSQLQQLCTAAHQYGMNVIVDVVSNHMSSDHSKIQSDLRASQYWHSEMAITDYTNRNQVINGKVGMPDLNTSNSYVQQVVHNYVQSLKSLGVDGIRWDAAKHIGLPSEGDTFWTNVLDSSMFNYGEIMDKPGGDNNTIIKAYSNLMNVTDHGYSGEIMGHVRDNGVYTPSGHWATEAGVDAGKLVLFGETHDSFSNDVKDGGWTKNLSQNYVDRAYALVASRANSQALYFSRPSSTNKENIYSGVKGSTHFTSSEVAAVNQFHNAMVGTQEAYTTGGGCSVVCREGGAVVVSPQGSNVQVTVPNANGLVPVGTYTDKVSNTSWTVTATEMTGTIGSKGIAVFYTDPAAKPSVSVNPGSKTYDTDTLTVNLTLNNATSGSYSIDGGAYTSFTANTSVTIGSGKDYGTATTLSVKASNGTETSDPVTYTYTKEDPNAGQTIYFDNSSYNWSNVYCYLYTDGGGEAAAWPGTAMTAGSNNLYTLKVPAGFETSKVIFTESETATTNRYPAELEPGMDMAGVSMIFGANHSWTEYSAQPSQPTQPTTPTTPTTPTQPTTPTTPRPDGTVLIGDVDGNGTISIKDATYIQAYLAEMMELSGNALIAADVNMDGVVSVKDVTSLQRYLVDLGGTTCHAGEIIGGGDETQPSTEPSPDKTILFSNNKGWSSVYAYAFDANNAELLGAWPGTAMTEAGVNTYNETQYSITVPGNTSVIVFTDGTAQTVDIPFDSSVTGYYPLDTQDENGHFNVGSWTDGQGEDNPPVPGGTVKFTNNRGWGNISAYAWDDQGNELLGAWPGTQMESIGYNDFNEPQFSITVPAGTVNIIFTDGISQTVDIQYDNTVSGYYPTGAVDGAGNYEVGSWIDGQGEDNPPVPGGTVLFTNNRGWGSISAYAWSADNTELLGAWPGTAMESIGNNDLGEPQYSITVPEGTAYIIFTDGISQTVDIPYNNSVTGYYPTGAIDGSGNYEVDSWIEGQSGGGGDNPPGPGTTVLFTNNRGWGNILAYAWDANGAETLGAWPGTAMQSIGNNDLGEPQFSITVPEGSANIIFTDGISQTVDIPYDSSVTGYYPTGATDGAGSYEVGSWTEGQSGGGTGGGDTPSGTKTVLFTNNFNWGAVYCYAWDESENKLLGEWPGTQMTGAGDNGYGSQNFSAEVPLSATHIIFSGGGQQTVDIPFDQGVTGWYLTGNYIDGKLEVASWIAS